MNIRLILAGLAASAALCAMPGTTRAQIFVTSNLVDSKDWVGEYTTSGATVNAALLSGLGYPTGIAVSGGNLFVASLNNGTIGEYTTSGATVNAALISGLSGPQGIALSEGNLFVVTNFNGGTIGKYTTSGATVNATLVSGLGAPVGIAVSGGNLFVTEFYGNTIGEYTTSGATVNAALVSGVISPNFIAVVDPSVPEAPIGTLLLLGVTAMFGLKRSIRVALLAPRTSKPSNCPPKALSPKT
jgi:hypothetical protein